MQVQRIWRRAGTVYLESELDFSAVPCFRNKVSCESTYRFNMTELIYYLSDQRKQWIREGLELYVRQDLRSGSNEEI